MKYTQNRPMRVIEIISGTGVNGAAVTCREVIRALAARGHDLTLVCREGAWIADQVGQYVGRIVHSDLHRWPPDQLRRVGRMACDQGIDVIHTHMSRANFFGVLLRWLFGVPCVATANNRYIQLHWMFNDRVIAVSEATRRFHRRFNLVPDHRIDVIPNFIDPGPILASDAETGRLQRAAWGLSSEHRVLGYLGDVIGRKGLLDLVRALPQVVARYPQVRLVIAGHDQNQYATRVRREAASSGVVTVLHWLGFQRDIASVLSALDVFVLPTREDNLPLSVLEAMAAGLPVVASAVGGLPECVVPGRTGLLVPPRDPSQLADALVYLLGNPDLAVEFGQAGRRRILAQFTAESQVQRLEACFTRAAEQAKRATRLLSRRRAA